MTYTTPKPKAGPKRFDFGLAIYTSLKVERRPHQKGSNHFDFGIVIYTNPKPKEGPEGISNRGTGKTVQGPSSTGKTVPQAIKNAPEELFVTQTNLNIGSGKPLSILTSVDQRGLIARRLTLLSMVRRRDL